MQNKGFKQIQLLILMVSILQFSTLAQSPKYFIITGKIISESENSDKVSVEVVKTGKASFVSHIETKERFRLELGYNAEYQLVFKLRNHIAKTIVVNTCIPNEVLQANNNFPHFLMAVRLEKKFDETEVINSEEPAQHIMYSPQTNNFTRVPTNFDVEYAEGNLTNDKQPIGLDDSKSKNQGYKIF